MRVLVFALILANAAMGQRSAILDDLQDRANAALSGIHHATTLAEVEQRRASLRRALDESLGLHGFGKVDPIKAFMYLPEKMSGPAPAIIILNPHEDPSSGGAVLLASSLARLGFIVVSLDVREHHARLDLLVEGATPEALIQHDVRAALGYLLASRDVDRTRIGLAGATLAATIAAAMNPEFSAMALTGALPDFNQEIVGMRALESTELPDSCDLIPGLLHYAATEELIGMIAPRPVQAINPTQKSFDYATELYRSLGISGKLYRLTDAESAQASRYATYHWFAQWLQGRTDLGGFVETESPGLRSELMLSTPTGAAPSRKQPVSEAALTSILGSPLNGVRMTIRLNSCIRCEVRLTTQPGIEIPVTVYRPGPAGIGSARGALIALDDRGREALDSDEVVQEARRRGWVVFAVDPRGIGELKTGKDAFILGVSLLLGENFIWRQAADIRRILSFVGRPDVSKRSGIYARGKNATLAVAYVAATADQSLTEWIALRDPLLSIQATGSLPLYLSPFKALSLFDVSGLLTASQTKVVVIDKVDEFIVRTEW